MGKTNPVTLPDWRLQLASTPDQRWISQGLLRYVDQKKFPALFEAVAGRQLPGTALQNKPGTKRILAVTNLVGWRNVNQEDVAHFGVADAVARSMPSE